MKLRPYQDLCRNAIYQWFEVENGNPLVIMATGTGKSVCIADFIKDVQQAWPDQRIVVAVDVKELIAQNFQKLMQMWPDASAGVYSAGLGKRNLHQKTLFVGIQSVYDKAFKIQRCDILIVDEAHMISEKESGMWQQFITELRKINPHMKIIGFTATEYRMDSGLLHTGDKRMFDGICYRYSIKEAIDDGYLCEIVPKGMATKVDLAGVKKRGGDYIESEQGKRWNVDEITRSAVDEILEYAATRRSVMVFSSGVDHAYAIAEELKARGETVGVVTGETPDGERDQMLSDFKTMRIKYIVNNAVLTKGFDAPNVDLIAVLRKTLSPVLWLQILGRGTRVIYTPDMPLETAEERLLAIAASVKPNCLLLDFGGNTRHFGAIDQIKFKDKGETGDGVPPMKDCPECGTIIFAGCRTCPAPVLGEPKPFNTRNDIGVLICGHKFPEPEIKIEAKASNAAVISHQATREEKVVREVRYELNQGKAGKRDTLKVTYYMSAIEKYSEWVCLEHPMESYPRQKAALWWRQRFDYDRWPELQTVPKTIDEALGMVGGLKQPSKIWVKPQKENPKYFEVCGHDFTPPAADQQFQPEAAPLHQDNQSELSDDDIDSLVRGF